jgi:integrase/recombinase XerD
MQVRNFSPHTQTSYVQQVSRFARHFQQSPEGLGPEEIRAYQLCLTNDRKLAVTSILITVAALRFLYTATLKKTRAVEDIIPAPKKPHDCPLCSVPRKCSSSGLCPGSQASRDPDDVLRGGPAHP